MDVRWGTDSPISIQDPKYKIILPINVQGQFAVQVADSRKFLMSLVGTIEQFDQNTYIRKKGKYLCGWHKGNYDTIGQTYQKMIDYAALHQLKLGMYAYEEYLIAEIAQRDHDQYVTYIRMEMDSD